MKIWQLRLENEGSGFSITECEFAYMNCDLNEAPDHMIIKTKFGDKKTINDADLRHADRALRQTRREQREILLAKRS